MGDWTPEPWEWNNAGIVVGPRHNREYVLWFGNSINPDHLDPPVGPNEAGPRWWAALLGACGKNTENQAHFNGPRITQCVNALAGIPDPAAYVKAMQSLTEACEKLRSEWTAKHVAKTPLDYAVVEVILAVSDALRTLSTPESEVKRG